MLEQEWEMPCLRLPVVKVKNNPISSRTGAGVGPKCTLLQHGGLRTAGAGAGLRGWHGTAGSAPSADGHRACSSGSCFIFNSAGQRDGERKGRVLPWVEVQRALFSHYEHCVAIMDNYNLTSPFIFFKNHTKALKPETPWWRPRRCLLFFLTVYFILWGF